MTNASITIPVAVSWSTAEAAVGQLCSGKGTFDSLWQLIRALCELGLGDLVKPVLDTITIDSPAWVAQRTAILEQTKLLPGGTVIWGSRSQIFADNIAALSAANPFLKTLLEFWEHHQDQYALFQANDGNFQVVDRHEPVIFASFIGGLIDHRALMRFWTYTRIAYQMPQPIAFDGAGYGWVLARVLESTDRTLHNFSCAVYVAETDLASACILLHLHDLRPWRERLRLFAGPNAQQELEAALHQNSNWDLPGNMASERITLRPPLNLQTTVESVAKVRAQRDASLTEQINAHYAAIPLNGWATKYEQALRGGKPLTVMGLTSRYTTVLQYSMDELGAAIRAAGHHFILCKEPDDQCGNVPELQMIHEHKPDLLVMISRMRYENPRLPKNVPALCWDQDNLHCMRTEAAKNSLDAMTYVAGAGARLGYEQLDWPRRNCILAFQAAATHRYHNGPVSEALLEKHRCTFSYTSNASGIPESLAAEQRNTYANNPRDLAFFDRVAQEVLAKTKSGYAWDTARVQHLIDSCIARDKAAICPIVRQEMILHLRLLSDRAFRHVALGWVAEYCRKNNRTLRLYGNGWEKNPQFASYAAGFLPPGEEVRAVFQASDINLQIIETGFLHSRVLDGLAAGGFFLYRLAPEARDLDHTEHARLVMTQRALETECVTYGQLDASTDPLIAGPWAYARSVIRLRKPDERCQMLDIWKAAPSEETQFPDLDQITFDGQEQFNQMANRFLANADLRQSVAARLRQVVVDRFSYDARWRQFLTGMAEGLREAAAESQSTKIVKQAA